MDEDTAEIVERARLVERTYRIAAGVYVIGSLERGVTVYNQQVRAHNLMWALWELSRETRISPNRVAIVGGGVTGLTAAACASSLFPSALVSIFEKRSELCPLQLGSDNRWVHPKVYDWPSVGSRAPSASLPVLNWSEGRASDVARQVINQFMHYTAAAKEQLHIHVGVSHLRIDCADHRVEWIGNRVHGGGRSQRFLEPKGTNEQFDIIILACGFGLEITDANYRVVSYWRNEQIAQPVLNDTRHPYVISGYGDGAIVDLCRLTIGRFRQDTVLYEMFGERLECAEAVLRKVRDESNRNNTATLEILEHLDPALIELAERNIVRRLRTDTKVILHLGGKQGTNNSIRQIFGEGSSFLNQFFLFLLYRCGAFSPSFDDLQSTVKSFQVPSDNVICRHGTDPMKHLLQLFVDPDCVRERFEEMKSLQAQTSARHWVPGCFPRRATRG